MRDILSFTFAAGSRARGRPEQDPRQRPHQKGQGEGDRPTPGVPDGKPAGPDVQGFVSGHVCVVHDGKGGEVEGDSVPADAAVAKASDCLEEG